MDEFWQELLKFMVDFDPPWWWFIRLRGEFNLHVHLHEKDEGSDGDPAGRGNEIAAGRFGQWGISHP